MSTYNGQMTSLVRSEESDKQQRKTNRRPCILACLLSQMAPQRLPKWHAVDCEASPHVMCVCVCDCEQGSLKRCFLLRLSGICHARKKPEKHLVWKGWLEKTTLKRSLPTSLSLPQVRVAVTHLLAVATPQILGVLLPTRPPRT